MNQKDRDDLTKSEQKEIRNFIRSQISGEKIDLDDLPMWLAEIVQENTCLMEAVAKIANMKWAHGVSFDARAAFEMQEIASAVLIEKRT